MAKINAGTRMKIWFFTLVLAIFIISTPSFTRAVYSNNDAVLTGVSFMYPNQLRFTTSMPMTKQEKQTTVQYFLAALTVPEPDLWVNLNPHKKEEICPYRLGLTELGKTMLEQDFLLKRRASQLCKPDKPVGKLFNDRAWYERNGAKYLSRHWIFPKAVEITEDDSSMHIDKAILDIESDTIGDSKINESIIPIFQATVDPVLRQEVRRDKTFLPIRQAYSAVICAIWFKNKYQDAYQQYINENMTAGIEKATYKEGIWDKAKNNLLNGEWKGPGGLGFCGGVIFKQPAIWIKVAYGEPDSSGRYFFDVELSPSQAKRATGSDKLSIPDIGGIRLNAQIKVRKSPFPKIEWPAASEGIDYKIIK